MAAFLRPMDKPSAIKLNRSQPLSMPGPKPVECDENFEYDVEAFGMMLFSCPATIETFVEYWVAHERTDELEPKEAVTQLLQSLINTEPILQVTSQKMADALGRRMRYDNAITFLTNFHQNNDHHDYQCSDALLIEKSGAIAESECPQLFSTRFTLILTGLLAHNASAAFQIKKINASQTAIIYRGFKYDKILAACYDRSAFFLAYVTFTLRLCAAMIPDVESDEGGEGEEESEQSSNTSIPKLTPEQRKEKIGRLTREEFTFEVYALIDDFICHIRHRSQRLDTLDAQVPENLLKYHKGVHDGTKIIFGIPIEVLVNEKYTLLYIEWLWKSEIWRKHSSVKTQAFGAEASGGPHQTVAGLLRIIEDLWRAKSLVLYSNYYIFFETWDEKRLMPIIDGFDSLSS